jgi:hypothetical protein
MGEESITAANDKLKSVLPFDDFCLLIISDFILLPNVINIIDPEFLE